MVNECVYWKLVKEHMRRKKECVGTLYCINNFPVNLKLFTNIKVSKWAKDLHRHFTQDVPIAHKHLKRCSRSLVNADGYITWPATVENWAVPQKKSNMK